jgi:hypothetical protein
MSTQSKTGLEVPVTPEESVLPRRPPVRYAFDPELAPIVEMLPTLAYDDPQRSASRPPSSPRPRGALRRPFLWRYAMRRCRARQARRRSP